MRDEVDTVEDRLEIGEIVVRAFMATGVVIWTLAAFAGVLTGNLSALYTYGAIAFFTLIAFALGEFYQYAASALLLAGAIALAVWGVVSGWELGIWVMVGVALIVPALMAASLFLFEEREEKVIERAEQTHHIRAVHA